MYMAMKLLSTVTMTVIFILVLLTTTTATTNTRIMKITMINTFGNGRFEFGRMKDKSEFRKYTFRLQFH